MTHTSARSVVKEHAELMRRVRQSLHMSQEEFSKLIGRGNNDIARYETCYTPIPKATMLLVALLEKAPAAVHVLRDFSERHQL